MTKEQNIDPAMGHEYGKPGVYDGIKIEHYHGSNGLSKTGLDLLARSPSHYYSMKKDPARPPEVEKASHTQGNLLHCVVLEPGEFPKRYATLPADAPKRPTESQWNAAKPSPKSIADMTWWTDFGERNAGKTIIPLAQMDAAQRMRDSIMRIPDARDLFAKGKAEQSAYAIDEETGVLLKCRPDWNHPVGKNSVILADVKGYSDARESMFALQAARMSYDVQDVFYTDVWTKAAGVEVLDFIFVVVEDKWPFAANLITITPEDREVARRQYKPLVKTYAQCLASGEWPGFPTGVKTVKLPSWKARSIEALLDEDEQQEGAPE
jgi:exodeoxyribonuclease VIII